MMAITFRHFRLRLVQFIKALITQWSEGVTMKTFTKIFATLGLVSFLMPASVMAEDFKIGVIDMRTILTKSPQAQAATEKLKKEFKAREEQLVQADKALKEKTEKLQRNSAVMSDGEKAKLEKELMISQRDLQRMQSEFREDATVRHQEETKKLIEKINAIVADIAKKEKYDLVLHSEAVPYSSKQVDITEKVIKAISTT